MEHSRAHSLTVYQKSLSLRDLSNALAYYLAGEARLSSRKTLGLRVLIAESIENDASLLPGTIEKAHVSSSKSKKLQSVAFIQVIAKNLLSYCNGLEKDGVKEREYLQLLRKEISIFQESFGLWRRSLVRP